MTTNHGKQLLSTLGSFKVSLLIPKPECLGIHLVHLMRQRRLLTAEDFAKRPSRANCSCSLFDFIKLMSYLRDKFMEKNRFLMDTGGNWIAGLIITQSFFCWVVSR